jgi:hypothetical protein
VSAWSSWPIPLVLTAAISLCAQPRSRASDDFPLQERFQTGYEYHVSARVELTGSLNVPTEKDRPARPLPFTGSSAIEYDERVLGVQAGGGVEKTARIYRRIDFSRKVGDRPQQSTIRSNVRRLIVMRLNELEVPFSPEGPLTWNEIDLVRTDVFTPALNGLLAGKAVRPGDRWPADELAVKELTDLQRLEDGKVECQFEEVTLVDKRRHARVAFSGTVRGINEDGPNRQQLDGYLLFDLESRSLSYLYLHGISFLLDKDGKAAGQVEGRFVLTRQANTACRELSSETWKNVATEPNSENTRLVYEDQLLGLTFLYPRHWRVAWARGPQVALEEPNGNGLLLTLESPKRLPTGVQFQNEVHAWLGQQKAKELRTDRPKRLTAGASNAEQFDIEAELAGQRVVLDYYIVPREPLGGATLAARLLPADFSRLRFEIEQLAHSITLTRRIAEPAP